MSGEPRNVNDLDFCQANVWKSGHQKLVIINCMFAIVWMVLLIFMLWGCSLFTRHLL